MTSNTTKPIGVLEDSLTAVSGKLPEWEHSKVIQDLHRDRHHQELDLLHCVSEMKGWHLPPQFALS